MQKNYDLENIANVLGGNLTKGMLEGLSEMFLQNAGERANYILGRTIKVCGDQSVAVKWLYGRHARLSMETPFEYCKSGRDSEIEQILGQIEYGVF